MALERDHHRARVLVIGAAVGQPVAVTVQRLLQARDAFAAVAELQRAAGNGGGTANPTGSKTE